MSAKRITGSNGGKLTARTVLVFAAAMGAAAVGVLGAGTAAARPVSLTLKYTCTFPVVGGRSVSMRVGADIPKSIAVGASTPRFILHGVATVVDSITSQALRQIGVRAVDGTVNAAATVTAPQGKTHVSVRFKLAHTKIPTSGPFDLEATAKAPAFTFKRPGTGRITVGDLILHLAPKDANGNLPLGNVDAPCKLGPGQNDVLASFPITSAPHPVTPKPVTPKPVTPKPVTATPVTPKSVTTTPVTLKPVITMPTHSIIPGPPRPRRHWISRYINVSAISGLGALVAAATALLLVPWVKHRRSGNE